MVNLLLTCGDTSARVFYSIALGIDAAVYSLVDVIYSVFIVICNTQLFSATTFEAFSTRIYAILGVIMLFVVASQLLMNIADPEKASSGEASTGKLAKNIIISLIAIVLLPTAFKYLYAIQKAVVTENIIGNIIIGGYASSTNADYADMIKNTGKDMALNVFLAFANPEGYAGNNEKGCQETDGLTYCVVYDKINDYGSSNYGKISEFGKQDQVRNEMADGDVEYRWPFSTLAGIMVAYFLLSFSIDMGVRVAKLAYYQLIAPIPIIFRIIPKKQDVFDNWVKGLMGTYLGVFIRLMVVYFCIFLINVIPAAWNNIVASGGGSDRSIVNVMVYILLIFGVFIFMKEAPKLISSMLGVSDGDMSLGIGKKLAGAAVIGGVSKKAYGGLTGSLGGGWDAMMNGENVWAGIRTGGLGGWDKGGRQFGNQRTELYKSRTGDYKGKPGLFGGKSFDTKYRGSTGKYQDAAFLAASSARIDVAKAAAGASYTYLYGKTRRDIMLDPSEQAIYTNLSAADRNAYIKQKAEAKVSDTLKSLSGKSLGEKALAIASLKSSGASAADIAKLSSVGSVMNEEAERQAKVQEEKDLRKASRIIGAAGVSTPPPAGGSTPPPAGGGATGGGKP